MPDVSVFKFVTNLIIMTRSFKFLQNTVGDEKYEALCNHYYRGATVAIICYGN